MKRDILVSEVGPRDGLQSIKSIMPLAAKKAWITALAASGLREIEVGSFVPAQVLPQLADTAEVVAHALHDSESDRRRAGARTCAAPRRPCAPAPTSSPFPFSASETHSLKNVRRTHAQMFDEVRGIVALLEAQPAKTRPRLEGGLSTAFGCTYEGDRAGRQGGEARRSNWLRSGLRRSRPRRFGGLRQPGAGPRPRRARARGHGQAAIRRAPPAQHARARASPTSSPGLEVDVDTFDSSMAGIGGCPFAPGATGNIVTEDLVFMLEAMGLNTGIDLDKLIAARDILAAAVPNEELYGYVPAAGLPRGASA